MPAHRTIAGNVLKRIARERVEDFRGTDHLRGARAPVRDTRGIGAGFPENSALLCSVAGRSPFGFAQGRSAPHVQPRKSATPSHTSWTAIARIRKPKIL